MLDGVQAYTLRSNGYLSMAQSPAATPALVRARMDDQRDVMAEFARRSQIRFLDLAPSFQADAARGTELYYLGDTHWNQGGHVLAAQIVANYLASQ